MSFLKELKSKANERTQLNQGIRNMRIKLAAFAVFATLASNAYAAPLQLVTNGDFSDPGAALTGNSFGTFSVVAPAGWSENAGVGQVGIFNPPANAFPGEPADNFHLYLNSGSAWLELGTIDETETYSVSADFGARSDGFGDWAGSWGLFSGTIATPIVENLLDGPVPGTTFSETITVSGADLLGLEGETLGVFFSATSLQLAVDNVRSNIGVAPIPLPATGWMLLAGLGLAGVCARRKNKS